MYYLLYFIPRPIVRFSTIMICNTRFFEIRPRSVTLQKKESNIGIPETREYYSTYQDFPIFFRPLRRLDCITRITKGRLNIASPAEFSS